MLDPPGKTATPSASRNAFSNANASSCRRRKKHRHGIKKKNTFEIAEVNLGKCHAKR
jgi:hypothetical protein